MSLLTRVVLILGAVLLLLGGLLFLLERFGIQFGYLPGDIRITHGNLTCLIGLGSSFFLSIILTIVLNLLARRLR